MSAFIKNLLFIAFATSPLWLVLLLASRSFSAHENPMIWILAFLILQVFVVIVSLVLFKVQKIRSQLSRWTRYSLALPVLLMFLTFLSMPLITKLVQHFQRTAKIEITGYEEKCVFEGYRIPGSRGLRASATSQVQFVFEYKQGGLNYLPNVEDCTLTPVSKFLHGAPYETIRANRSFYWFAGEPTKNSWKFLKTEPESKLVSLDRPHINAVVTNPQWAEAAKVPLVSEDGNEVLWDPIVEAQAVNENLHYRHTIQDLQTRELSYLELPLGTYRVASFTKDQVVIQRAKDIYGVSRKGQLLWGPFPVASELYQFELPLIHIDDNGSAHFVSWGESWFETNLSGQIKRFSFPDRVEDIAVDWDNKRVIVFTESHSNNDHLMIFDGAAGKQIFKREFRYPSEMRVAVWKKDYLAVHNWYKTFVFKMKK